MRQLILVLTILLLISSSCKKQHVTEEIQIKDVPFPLKLVKEKETRIDAPGYPGFVPLTNSDHFMIRLEYKDTAFLTYDPGLNLVKEGVIKYGEGPLECLMPVAMGGDEDNLIITDIVAMKYYIYDRDFKTRRDITAKRRGWIPHGVNFSPAHNVILSCYHDCYSNRYFAEYYVYLRKLAGNRLDDTEIFKIKDRSYTDGLLCILSRPVHFRMIDDYIYILKKADYRVMKMDINGNVLKEIGVTGLKKIRFSKRERGEWVEALGHRLKKEEFTFPEYLWHANFIMKLADGIAVGRIEDYNPQKREWIDADYFDKDLNFLGKIKLPWFPASHDPGQLESDLFFLSKGDKLYFIDTRENGPDEEYWLTRWKIEK